MNEHDALLRAIIEDPDDHDSRLVYADWLEENGKTKAELARAKFIRTQYALLDESNLRSPDLQSLRQCERELRDEYAAEWLAPLDLDPGIVEWKVGFVDLVYWPATRFLERAPRLTTLTPLTKVALADAANHIFKIVHSPCINRITSLALKFNDLGPDHIFTLANAWELYNLRELNLYGNHIGDEGAVTLANSRARLRSLDRLDLGHNGIRRRGTVELASSPVVFSLEFLGLRENRIGSVGALALNTINTSAPIEIDLRGCGLDSTTTKLLRNASSEEKVFSL